MERYSIINNKNPREIVLLRGRGCKWKKCIFCDYYLDCSDDESESFALNKAQLDKVSGVYEQLEVINSGSYCELDKKTLEYIVTVCKRRKIKTVYFECHYMYKNEVPKIKAQYRQHGINIVIKTGAETFDADFRDDVLKKGFNHALPRQIAEYADEVCLLFGLTGQSTESMHHDIETGLEYFNRVCVNIMTENTTKIIPDANVIKAFTDNVYGAYADNGRVDILLHNTDFGVGKQKKSGVNDND